jgi:uncharacterized protein YndB with AHSA1/START domain
MSNDTDPSQSVVIERMLDAAPDLVWRMWTVPDHFAAWYGPSGASITVAEMDVSVGGRRHVCMTMETPNGTMQMWFVGEHLVLDEPHRLVYTESISDEVGNIVEPSSMGMPDGHPTITEVSVDLSPRGDGTRLVLTHAGVPADSPGATGWNMALDQLEATLAG